MNKKEAHAIGDVLPFDLLKKCFCYSERIEVLYYSEALSVSMCLSIQSSMSA